MTLGLNREHKISTALTIVTLMLSAGAMLAYTTYFLTSQINAVAVASTRALDAQRDVFDQQYTLMLQRVTILEANAAVRDKAIDRLNVLIDQQSAILRDLAVSQKSLETTLEAMSKSRR